MFLLLAYFLFFVFFAEDQYRDYSLERSVEQNQKRFELLKKEGIVNQNEKLCYSDYYYGIELGCVALTKKNTENKPVEIGFERKLFETEIEISRSIILKDKTRVKILKEIHEDIRYGAFNIFTWVYKVKLENGEEKFLYRETYGGKLLEETVVNAEDTLIYGFLYKGSFVKILVNDILKSPLGWIVFILFLISYLIAILNISLLITSKFEELESKVFKNLFWRIVSWILKIKIILITAVLYFLHLLTPVFLFKFSITLLIFVIILTIIIKVIKKRGIKC